MAETSIEWTDATWNPVAGCSIVSPGCHNCYAMTMAARLEAMGQDKYRGLTKKPNGKALWTGKITLDEKALEAPLKWKKPKRVFVNSMSDLFHEDVPDEFIDRVFSRMLLTPQHVYQVLTKRPARMLEWVMDDGEGRQGAMCYWAMMDHEMDESEILRRSGGGVAWPLPNVWLGVSVEDQQRADERIPLLLQTPAAVRFLSCEPLLGPIELGHLRRGEDDAFNCLDGIGGPNIDWCIVGGESGHGARPCNLSWIRSIVDQCKAAGVSCFVKQLGSKSVETQQGPDGWAKRVINDKKGGDINEWPEDLRVRDFPRAAI